jgi:hypothetical protein
MGSAQGARWVYVGWARSRTGGCVRRWSPGQHGPVPEWVPRRGVRSMSESTQFAPLFSRRPPAPCGCRSAESEEHRCGGRNLRTRPAVDRAQARSSFGWHGPFLFRNWVLSRFSSGITHLAVHLAVRSRRYTQEFRRGNMQQALGVTVLLLFHCNTAVVPPPDPYPSLLLSSPGPHTSSISLLPSHPVLSFFRAPSGPSSTRQPPIPHTRWLHPP